MSSNVREVKMILGHFEIIGDIRYWHPSDSHDLSAEAQFNHNCDIDPEFHIIEYVDRRPLQRLTAAAVSF
jgi:hypothetical protein